jgi:putative ABC transport system substrate-binding protein
MMRRRSCMGAALAALPSLSRAQSIGRPARIAWIASLHFGAFAHRGVFIEAMRALGWTEETHYVVESFSYESRFERIPALAAEIAARKPDVVLASGTPTVGPMMKASASLPIVFFAVGDPVGSGFVTQLSRPGGNATGLGGLGEGLVPKWLEILTQAVPRARRIGVAHNPDFGPHADGMSELDAAAVRMGVSLHKVAMRSPDDLRAGFAALAGERVEALCLLPQPWHFGRPEQMAALCLEHRLPALTLFDELARAGVMMAYGWRLSDLVRRVPWYVDRILKGAAPAELPVEQPSRFYLTLNLKTARAIGLPVPGSLLMRAEELIE